MGLIHQVEVKPLSSIDNGMTQFYTPQASHETMLVKVEAGVTESLFVHHFQTDQLLAVSGSIVLIILQNRNYQYIHIQETRPQVVTIPPGIPHSSVNLSSKPCLMINAVLRHGDPDPRDYRPLKPPFPYDLDYIKQLIGQKSKQSVYLPWGDYAI